MERKPGHRPEVILDSIDSFLINKLKNKTYTITELEDKSGIQIKTLKPHLERLRKRKLITSKKEEKSRKVFYDLTPLALEIIKLGILVSLPEKK